VLIARLQEIRQNCPGTAPVRFDYWVQADDLAIDAKPAMGSCGPVVVLTNYLPNDGFRCSLQAEEMHRR
jgi:hypothetical protein